IVGFLYDTILRLWEQQNIVQMERNVFAQYKFNVKELLMMKNLYIPILKSVNDGKYDRELAFMERWIEKILPEDTIATMYYNHVRAWVNSDEKYWRSPSLEKLLAASKRGLEHMEKDLPEE
ncbi:MAG: hypothetical protein KAU14_09420, partial [Thermoplasmata archaeon]|nr:hypothetical protein [Thermoplasmata archaeon]